MAQEWREPPDWFKGKDYSYLRALDAGGWLKELERCKQLRDKIDLSPWEPLGEPGWTNSALPAFIGPPPVQVVDKADQSNLSALEKPSLIVQIYLNAPDRIIVEEFKNILRLTRKKIPPPVRIPGPDALAAQFTETKFLSWINHHIVEFCELEAWRSELPEGEQPKNADFGRWLFSTYSDSDKEIAEAREALAAAIESIPALWAQVAHASDALPVIDPKQG
jgi:hypothetical protein